MKNQGARRKRTNRCARGCVGPRWTARLAAYCLKASAACGADPAKVSQIMHFCKMGDYEQDMESLLLVKPKLTLKHSAMYHDYIQVASKQSQALEELHSCSFQVGGYQNYGPFLGTLNIRCRIIIGTQKGTIILTTTQVHVPGNFVGSSRFEEKMPRPARNPFSVVCTSIWGFPKIRGTFFGGPHNKDYSIGVYIGVPLFWETTILASFL